MIICVYEWPSLGKTSAFNINVHIRKDGPVALAKSSNQKKKKEEGGGGNQEYVVSQKSREENVS